MTKKQLYITVGIIAVVALGFLLASYLISRRAAESGVETTNPFANFFPFGKSEKIKTTDLGNTDNETAGEGTENINTEGGGGGFLVLRTVSQKPVAGLFSYIRSGKTYVEYIEKETGNVYEMKMEDMRPSRLSNSLITRVSEAYFGNDGGMVVLRYLKPKSDAITTFILDLSKITRGTLPEDNATTTASDNSPLPNGKFLASGIRDVKVSEDTKGLFYLTRTGDFTDRLSVGSVFDFQKNTSSDVFLSPFSEWLPVYFDGHTAILQTKASRNVPGFLYSFNIKTGDLQKIIGDISGLTALPSHDNQKIVYSESTRNGVTLHIYDRKDSSTKDFFLQTLPEKCVWKKDNASLYCAVPSSFPSGEYPDSWYQGISSFSDNIWEINAITGKTTSVFVPGSLTMKLLDMTNLTLSPSEDFLFFINKRDSSLWAFDLAGGWEE